MGCPFAPAGGGGEHPAAHFWRTRPMWRKRRARRQNSVPKFAPTVGLGVTITPRARKTSVAMQLKAGLRLRSVTDTGEVVVVRAPAEPVDLRCGGHALAAID